MELERPFEELSFIEQMDVIISHEPPVIGLHHRMIYYNKEHVVDWWKYLKSKIAFASIGLDELSPSDVFVIQFLANRFDVEFKNQEPS